MKPYGEFDVYIIQSTVYVEPKSLDCDLEGAWEACHFILAWFPSAAAAPVRRIWTVSLRRWRRIWGRIWSARSPLRWSPSDRIRRFP